MIVEIHGVDCDILAKEFLPRFGFIDITRIEGLNKKIRLSADTGEARLVDTYRSVWGAREIRVFLREPGELCITISGSRDKVAYIVKAFLADRYVLDELFVALLNDTDALDAYQ